MPEASPCRCQTPSAPCFSARLFPEPLGSFRNPSFLSAPSPSFFSRTPRSLRNCSCVSGSTRFSPDLSGSPSFTSGVRVGVASPHFVPDFFRSPSALSADRAGPLCGADVTSGRAIKGRVQAARAVRGGGRGAGGRSLRTHRPGEGWGEGRAGGAVRPLPRSARTHPAPHAQPGTGVRVSRGRLRPALPPRASRPPLSLALQGSAGRFFIARRRRAGPGVSARPSGERSEGRGRGAGEGRAGRERPQPPWAARRAAGIPFSAPGRDKQAKNNIPGG